MQADLARILDSGLYRNACRIAVKRRYPPENQRQRPVFRCLPPRSLEFIDAISQNRNGSQPEKPRGPRRLESINQMTEDMNNHQNDPLIVDEEDKSPQVGELLSRCRAGQEDAATTLYLRYARRLQRLAERQTDQKMAVRVDPEGVVQSVFRTFFRRVSDGQYNVSDGEELWNLLLVISLNKLRSRATRHRAAKRDVARTTPLVDSDQKQNNQNDEALLILRMTVDEIVGKLPETERDIIRLRIEGYEVKEIAEKTRRAKRSVERILQSFRRRLKEDIEG